MYNVLYSYEWGWGLNRGGFNKFIPLKRVGLIREEAYLREGA
jgi:hypothetical protein